MVLADNSIVGIKLGFYNETSNSTYIGLTQAIYDTGMFDFTHLSPDDRLDIRRYSASVTHDYFFSDNVRLKTTAFGYTTTRNWSREDFDNSPVDGRIYNRIVGNPGTPGGAIYFRNSTGNRNRQFEVLGVEPRLSVNYEFADLRNELDTGVRYLYERAFEQRVDGTPNQPTSGLLRDDEIRTGRAFSAYVQNRLFLSNDLTITPGIRLEYFNYERDIFRVNNNEVNVLQSNNLLEVIPGLGLNYIFGNGASAYAGAHRGFGPPRTKDAITTAGIAEDLDAERSWNVEAGIRGPVTPFIAGEVTVFYLDFSNQVIPVSESSGGVGSGLSGLINGGETRHIGVETAFVLDISQLVGITSPITLQNSATYTHATFSSDRFVNIGGGEVENVRGNTLPYAPEWIINTRLDITLPAGLQLGLDGTYIGRQFGDIRNSIAGSLNGRTGEIPAYYVFNAGLTYAMPWVDQLQFSLSVKNLFDERYIVSRRPQGIRVGLPRFISAGVDFAF
jgi:Fe(3+) dicitrate transport protein